MNWTIPSANIIKPLSTLGTALAVYAILRPAGFYNFTAREAEGLNVLIQLVGDIYAVLLAFAIFVIWGQFTEVENCVIREGDSLADILRLIRLSQCRRPGDHPKIDGGLHASGRSIRVAESGRWCERRTSRCTLLALLEYFSGSYSAK